LAKITYPFEDGHETIVSYMPFYHIAGLFLSNVRAIVGGWTQVILTTPHIDDIINSVVDYQATFFVGAPTMYEMLKDYDKTDKVKWKELKWCASGADALHEATALGWQERTGMRIEDWWGSTEFIAGILTPLGKGKLGSIGIPIPNTDIRSWIPRRRNSCRWVKSGKLPSSDLN
jgi:long-chain acyl-CoA synthetase